VARAAATRLLACAIITSADVQDTSGGTST